MYMSPEALTAPAQVGAASDIYALGAVGHYLATGRHLFAGKTFLEIAAHHLTTPPDPLPPGFAPPLADLILACLAKKAEHRPAGAAALQQSLLGMLDGWSEEAARAWWRDRRAELESLRRTRQAAGAPAGRAPI
jgi:serine/threonine protein kinase